MKKNGRKESDELRDEYDLSKLKRVGQGVYYDRYKKGTNVVLLESDVYKKFPTSKAVNDALRLLMKNQKARIRQAA
jgi:hypothetical protein